MPLVTQEDVETFFTPKLVRQVFTDDGNPREVGPRFGPALAAASDEAAAILGQVPSWSTEPALQALVDNDAGLKFNVCKLVMAIGIEVKPEWLNREGPHSSWRSSARDMMAALVKRQLRSPGEPAAGPNKVHIPRTVNARQWEFARRGNRGSSGSY